jgi:RNA polymerase sigma factor (sigma-70 family)
MNWEDGSLGDGLEKAYGAMGRELAGKIRPIVSVNLSRGRVHHFLREQETHAPSDYVWRVAEVYQRTNEYVHQVQVAKADEVWQPLYDKLMRWAYCLQRKGYHQSWTELEMTVAECAADAGAQIISSHFPFDTEFDGWAYTLLRYTSLKQLNRSKQQKRVPDTQLIELDVVLTRPQVPTGMTEVQRSNWHCDLLNGIERLATPARREVLLLRYYDNLTYEEIAKRMGRSIGAVYKLHFEAIEELKEFFEEDNS